MSIDRFKHPGRDTFSQRNANRARARRLAENFRAAQKMVCAPADIGADSLFKRNGW